jgi:hypothetical protein
LGCDDLFEHFKTLEKEKKLPAVEILESTALKLHRAFSSTTAIYDALDDTTIESDWTATVPEGTPWPVGTHPPAESNTKVKAATTFPRHPKGDRVLSNSITFMRDALLSRELSYAVAEGDVGRVYEVIKVSAGARYMYT